MNKVCIARCFRLLYLYIFITALSLRANAQDKILFNDVQYASARNTGPIYNAGKLTGYYFFYKTDNQDKHSNNYITQILDKNLQSVRKSVFAFKEEEELLETLFDGNRFICLILNEKSKRVTSNIYNSEGILIQSYPKILDKNSLYYFKDNIANNISNGGVNNYLHIIDSVGYFTLIPLKHNGIFSYEINIYRNDDGKELSYLPDADVKLEKPTYIGATNSLLLFSVLSKKVLVNNKYDSWLLAINIKDGTKKFIVQTTTNEYQYYPTSISAFEDESKIVIQGTYFGKDDKIQKAASIGMCTLTLDYNGLMLKTTYNNWEKDFSRYIVLVDTGGQNDLGRLYIHHVFKTANGKTFAVAEGYKRTANGLGILFNILTAATATGGIHDNSKLAVTDLVLLEFDSTYTIKDATVFTKNQHSAITFENDFVSTQILAAKAKMAGSFDYAFTEMDSSNQNFLIGYHNHEHSNTFKGNTFNTIRYKNGSIIINKINLDDEADLQWVFPAKPGFVLTTKYFRKDKRLVLQLRQLAAK